MEDIETWRAHDYASQSAHMSHLSSPPEQEKITAKLRGEGRFSEKIHRNKQIFKVKLERRCNILKEE